MISTHSEQLCTWLHTSREAPCHLQARQHSAGKMIGLLLDNFGGGTAHEAEFQKMDGDNSRELVPWNSIKPFSCILMDALRHLESHKRLNLLSFHHQRILHKLIKMASTGAFQQSNAQESHNIYLAGEFHFC